MIGFIKKAIGMSGLFRSPKRANELIDEQIFSTMKSLSHRYSKHRQEIKI